MQHAARREAVAQPADQLVGEGALGWPHRVGVPLFALEIVDRDEGRLAAQGQAHVLGLKVAVHRLAQGVEGAPRLVLERLGDAHRLHQARDRHLEAEFDPRRLDDPADRRGRAIVRRRGQGHVAFAAEQPRGGVQADPAGARNIDLGPGVQVGEVVSRALRPFHRVDVGLELDQVAGDEAGGEAQAAQDLDQQPGAVAAGPGLQAEGLVRGLHPRLHADHIADLLLQVRIQADQEVDGAHVLGLQVADEGVQPGAALFRLQIGRQVLGQVGFVGEGQDLGVGLDEEVERIDHVHLGGQVDLDAELVRAFVEHQPRQPVAVRILLPVDEVVGGRDLQRIAGDLGPAMRRRPQAHHLRTEFDAAVVAVARDVVQGGDNGQDRLRDAVATPHWPPPTPR